MVMEKFDPTDPDAQNRMRAMFGPQQVDHQIRMAIQCCWMSLPDNKKNVKEVEKQMRRLFERAIKDFRTDSASFEFGEDDRK